MGAAILNREDLAVDVDYTNASAVELADGDGPRGQVFKGANISFGHRGTPS